MRRRSGRASPRPALKASSRSASCCWSASTVSLARPTSCRSLRTRPAPRAAVVARPSVEALIAFRPRKAPSRVAPTEIAAWSPCCVTCSDSRSTAWPRAADLLLERGLLRCVLLAEPVERLPSRCSRPACCKRARKSPSVSPGLREGLEPRAGQDVELLCAEEPGGEVLSPGAVALRLARGGRQLGEGGPRCRGGLEVARGHRCIHRAVPVGGHGLRGQRRHDRHGLGRVEALLGVGEADLGRAEQHRLVDERGASRRGSADGDEVLRHIGRQHRSHDGGECRGGGRRGGRDLRRMRHGGRRGGRAALPSAS